MFDIHLVYNTCIGWFFHGVWTKWPPEVASVLPKMWYRLTLFKISIVSSNRTKYLSVRYVSATRLVVELARGTWCCKTNTDWRLRTDDFVSERFILTKPGQFLGDSRSEQSLYIQRCFYMYMNLRSIQQTRQGRCPDLGMRRDTEWWIVEHGEKISASREAFSFSQLINVCTFT